MKHFAVIFLVCILSFNSYSQNTGKVTLMNTGVTLDQVLSNPDSFASRTVVLKGFRNDACKMSVTCQINKKTDWIFTDGKNCVVVKGGAKEADKSKTTIILTAKVIKSENCWHLEFLEVH